MQFRPYQSGDFPRLYAVEEICFRPSQRFGRGYMRSLIAHPASATWIAEQDTAMAGFAIVHWSDNRSAYLQTLEVTPEWRRRGIARELLRLVEGSARDAGASVIWLHVDASNSSAIQLYRASGYEQQGIEEDYYGDGLNAAIYARALDIVAEPRRPDAFQYM